MRITKIKGQWMLRGERRVIWEPIEASQVEEVRCQGETQDSQLWGDGGAQALRWFELGETRSEIYQDPFGEAPTIEAQATATERVVNWVKTLFGQPCPYRLVGC